MIDPADTSGLAFAAVALSTASLAAAPEQTVIHTSAGAFSVHLRASTAPFHHWLLVGSSRAPTMARAGPPADGRGRGAVIGFSCDGSPTRRKIALAGPGTQGMPVN